jgi:hypothetical protein
MRHPFSRSSFTLTAVAVALLLAGTNRAFAQASAKAELRDMSTDRPDKTESPFTVDKGHFQTETDLVSWTRDRSGSRLLQAWSIMPTNIKFGLTNRIDLQVISEPVTVERVREDGVAATTRGFGTVTGRVKVNMWGNDGGRTAFAVMPFVTTTPTVRHAPVEGGVILPLGIDLGRGWNLGLMAELDAVAIEGTRKHKGVLVTSITTSHGITERTGFYVELFREAARSPVITTADAGLTFGVTPNIQFDAGVNVGMSRAADGVNPFAGLSIRF